MWDLWLCFNSNGKLKDGFLWEQGGFMGLVLAAGLTSSLICFYSADPPDPWVIREPPMVPLAASPSHTACFPIKLLYLTGTQASQVQQTSVWNCYLQLFHVQVLFLPLFVVVCFPQMSLTGFLMARTSGNLAPGTAVTKACAWTKMGNHSGVFNSAQSRFFILFRLEQVFQSEPCTTASSHDGFIMPVIHGFHALVGRQFYRQH